MVSLALARPGQRGLLLVFALLSFMVFAAAGAERASACASPALAPLALSTFEGGDGDQCDSDGLGARRDWQNIAGNPGLNSTIDAPSDNDTIYGPNTHDLVGGPTDENIPDSWNFQHGSVGSGKFDALAANSFTDPENGKLFLDLGFVRATTSGDTFLAFELNQRQPGYRTDANDADPSSPFKVPTRTRGDLLVTYHVGTAGAQTLGLCIWDCNEHSGQWEEFAADFSGAAIGNQSCPELSSSLYQAAINDGTGGREGAISGVENFLNPGTAIGAGQFGEAVVNLTEALRNSSNPDGPQPCVDFGYVWLHSRSSDSLTSSQQDFIMPDKAVSIGNCTVEGHKFNDLNGDGVRSADEPYLGGWTIFADYNNNGVLDNNMDGTFVNNMDGIVDPGEEEPYDVTADGTGSEALGTYRITKVQPSNKPSNPSGTWPIREVLQPTWDCTAAVGGGAVLTPNVCPEDTSTNPDSALGFRLAWTDNQIYSGRDFGNRRQPAQLTVVKHVVNDNGGTATASAWSLHVTSGGADVAGSPKVGSETGDTYSLTHGQTYNVSELGDSTGYHATYSGDCDASGNVTVTAGETKTCTITNNDVAPVLTVVKHVVNDNGGTQAAGDFSITVDDQGTNPASFAGAEAPGTDVTIDPGAYTVAEGAHAGYAVTYSAGCDSTLAIGEAKTCTITNNDVAPVLTVVKHVINDNGGTQAAGDFSITVDDQGTNPASFAGAESPGTDVTIDPGAYGVTEGVHTGYAVSYSAGCDSTIAIGETKTCTITNDDIPAQITVIKHMVNDDGGTASSGDWTLHLRDGRADVAGSPQAGSETGDTYTVPAGAYTVSESDGPAGYASSYSGDCGQQGHMTVALGESKTCTVTNDDIAPRLTVIKHVVNKGGSAATAADFQMDVRATDPSTAHFPGSEQGVTITLDAGDYSVDESGGPSTFAKELSADCSGAIGIGTEKTCTITNTKILPGGVVVKKGPAYAYHGDQLNFTFEVTNPGTTPLQNVVVTDNKCAPVVGPAQKLGGNADDLLDVGETWVYTCTMPVPAHSAGDTSLVNVVTMSATDADGEPVGDTDQHTTRILHPAIGIDKTGPATAQAGQPVDYALVVTNPGDVPFLAANVNVGDALCEAPPLLITTNGDATPGQLDPGDTWAYMCRVRTLVGQTQVNNVGVVTGTDSFGGHVVTDDDPATTTLTQPPAVISQAPAQVVAPAQSGVLGATAQSGTARLTGPSRCAKGPFEVKVAGRGIAQVRFALDGRTLKTVKAIAGRTVFKVKINPRGGGSKVHRVTARVTFTTASGTKARTLRYVYLRCPQQAVLPQFTG
jgi:uncharacterized repeat protein (TIGR01451 family)